MRLRLRDRPSRRPRCRLAGLAEVSELAGLAELPELPELAEVSELAELTELTAVVGVPLLLRGSKQRQSAPNTPHLARTQLVAASSKFELSWLA
jgi:hypothetical protein